MFESLLIATMVLNIVIDFMDRTTVRQGDLYALALWTTIIQFLLILPLVGLVGPMPLKAIMLCAVVGIFSAYGRIPWFRALASQRQTLSRLTPFVRLSSVMVLFAAFYLLGEPKSFTKIAGSFLMVGGSLLITMDSPVESIRQFVEHNRAAAMALIFAASLGAISIMYKYLLKEGADLFSMYFYLKLFQVCAMAGITIRNKTFAGSYQNILHLRLLVFGRVLQTISALAYLLVLSKLDLSVVEPIGALSPLIVLGAELVIDRHQAKSVEFGNARHFHRTIVMRVISLVIVGVGIFLFYLGTT